MTLAIKEMIYSSTRKREVLARGAHKGYEYAVVSYGHHPCAYVAVSEGQPYYHAIDFDEVDLKMHGGCTFVDRGFSDLFDFDKKVIGWDYGHYNDFSGTYLITQYPLSLPQFKKWTTKEMVAECEDVIGQLYVLEHSELFYK